MSPDGTTTEQGKIELLSQWKLEAEFRNILVKSVGPKGQAWLKN